MENRYDRGTELSIPICFGVSVVRHTLNEDASVEFALTGFLTAAEFFKFERLGHLSVYNDYNRVICTAAWVDEKGQPTKEKARFFFGAKGSIFLTTSEVVAVKKSLVNIEAAYQDNLCLGMYPESRSDEDSNVLEKIAKDATKSPAVAVKEATATTP